jgi:uncharacterized protein
MQDAKFAVQTDVNIASFTVQTAFAGRAAGKENPDADIESWWLEDMLAWAQVSGAELLSHMTAGTRAAVGCAAEARARRSEAPKHGAHAQRHRLTQRSVRRQHVRRYGVLRARSNRPRSLFVLPALNGSRLMTLARTFLTVALLLLFGAQRLVFAQEVSAKLGVARTIKSKILSEDRKVLVHLPAGYDTSAKSYPVLYLLDGTSAFLLEMIAVTNRLHTDHNAPEMIILAIENTNRDRDMMPVVAKDYPGPPRAEAFLGFLEKELVPDIERAYRTAQPRILQGKSLSGLFTIYALLAQPTAFNAYVACSAGWFPENNEYFVTMSTRAFQNVEAFANRRVFMANSLRDQYDPDQAIHRQMIEFSSLVRDKLGEAMSYRYETYQDYPHVPFPCPYDGLRFVTAAQLKK